VAQANDRGLSQNKRRRRAAKVLFVSHDSTLYGAQLSLLDFLSRLDRGRIEPFVISPEEGPLDEAIRNLGIPVHITEMVHWVSSGNQLAAGWWYRIARFCRSLWGRTRTIVEFIRDHEIEVVYTNTVTVIEGALAARIAGRPHIWHLREQVTGNSQLGPLVPGFSIPWIVRAFSTRTIANSIYLSRAYSCRPLRDNISVIYNGVDAHKFDEHREGSSAIRAEFNIPAGAKVGAIVGAVIPRKGQHLLIEAVCRVVRMQPDLVFLIVGQGYPEHLRRLQNRAHQCGIERNLRFTGFRTDIPRILGGIDLLVIASDQEPFGRTAIEAMAARVPVVATRCGGPEETIVDGVTGLLVPTGDVASMADAIGAVLSNPDLARRLGESGRARFDEWFTLDIYAENMHREFERVI
jgi:glycosyltransferase involved in cell wall biosynthesis